MLDKKWCANSMILQSQFESIVRKYESDSWGYTFYTQNDNYKIEMHHEAEEGNPRIEIHPENGTGYVCSYYAAYGDAEYTYLEGQCSNWNWNGSYEVTREIVSREGGWGMPISEKGLAIDGLVHGDSSSEVVERDKHTFPYTGAVQSFLPDLESGCIFSPEYAEIQRKLLRKSEK